MIVYLELREVMAIHDALVETYGGILGIRDNGLLESALSQPAQGFGDQDIFPDVPSKASAYAFYISENQPFLDGNKRTAVSTALTFLRLNGHDLTIPVEKANLVLYDVIMAVANKKLSREQLAAWFRKNSRKKRRSSPRRK